MAGPIHIVKLLTSIKLSNIKDDGLLAIPMSTSRWYQDTVEEDGKTYHYYGYEYISKLMLINANQVNL